MNEHRDIAGEGPAAAPTASHALAPKPRRKRAFATAPDPAQKTLELRAAVPLHVRPVLTYAELAALGIVPERTLRRLVAVGRVQRSVIRNGRRLRFVRDVLIAELLEAAR